LALPAATALALLALLAYLFLRSGLGDSANPVSGKDLLHQALDNASRAGSYAVNIALSQSVIPQDPFGMKTQEEWSRFDIQGQIGGTDRARFAITPGRSSFAQTTQAVQEMLVRDGVSYEWRQESGLDRWTRIQSAPSLVGMDSDNLSLLSVAKDILLLESATGLPGPDGKEATYQRVAFNLEGPDILRMMMGKQGALNAQTMDMAQRNESGITGTGELWIDSRGLPAHLILDLSWIRQAEIPYRVRAHTETDYTGFGRTFPAAYFDPSLAPNAGTPVAELVALDTIQNSMWMPLLAAALALVWLLLRAHRGSSRALRVLSILILVALLMPSFASAAEAAGLLDRDGTQAEESTAAMPDSQVREMLRDVQSLRRSMGSSMGSQDFNPLSALDEMGDEDGDGLPNGYEIQYGTNPFAADTDYDGLSDFDELNGITCALNNGTTVVKSNPMNPDTNQDGLMDGDEFHKGKCGDSYTLGWMWDDDNDNDKVPDGLDLSPFSWSNKQVLYQGGNWEAPQFTFETLDQNPNDDATNPYPFYVELQIRPREVKSLRWAYKYVTWPTDSKASIQNATDPVMYQLKKIFLGIDSGTSGEVKLVPFMQATVREKDLPTSSAMAAYGVSANAKEDAAGNPVYDKGDRLWDMTIPLMTVERGGQVFAFQAKMLHDRRPGNNDLTHHWRDVRLKWAAVADVLLLDSQGKPAESPNGGWGLWVYDEPYETTGLQVSRQGGASMLVATALPSNKPYDDGPISLLRGGLEARFLPGGITLSDIKNRFDTPNNATLEQRWGIPQDQQYRIVYDAKHNYKHLDEAIATTTMTTTKQLLDNEFYNESGIDPSFLYVSEQRTSTVNLDEVSNSNYLNITINTCLKPLVTSRTLKMQSYDWVVGAGDLFGHWEPMSLDAVLTKIEGEYAATTPANDPFYDEHLIILKMAMTTWHLGVTSIYKIGQLSLIDINNILTDPQVGLAFLENDGLIPKNTKAVVDKLLDVWAKGGPVVYLQNLWTTVVDTWNKVDHFFRGSYLDLANKTPDSYIKVIPMGDSGGGNNPPAPPGQPIDLQIAGYTQTALMVLGMLATLIANETLSTVVTVLTKIVQIYQQFRALVDTIKTIITISEKAKDLATAAVGFAKELSSMVKPMAVVGLIFAVAIIWLAVLIQIGDLGPSIALTVVLRAIVETVLAVVLFVVALIFPYGTIVAIAIGLIKMIEGLIGFQFDPISLLLDWLFGISAHQRTDLKGDPTFGTMTLESVEPGGGVVANADFKVSLPATAKLHTINNGSKSDLNKSYAQLHVGRFADWPDAWPNIKLPTREVFNKYKDEAGSFFKDEFHAAAAHIIYYKLGNTGWGFTAGHSESKGANKAVGNGWERTDNLLGWVTMSPSAGINKRLVLDIAMDVRIRYDQCSTVGGCDPYISDSTSPPAFTEFYFDILPSSLKGLWEWSETTNYDYDGDGLSGYQDPVTKQVYGTEANLCPNMPNVKSWQEWDSDGDGLSDFFEKTTPGFNPCKADTDNDGIPDGRELLIGTYPNDPDTDNDGLTDRQEDPFDNGFGITWPWIIPLSQQYPGLPNPPAFPNPRQANFDNDYRNDKKEKEKLSSPTSYNAIPVGEPLSFGIGQSFQPGGGQSFHIMSAPWANGEAIALNARLTLTMPVSLASPTSSAKLNPPVFVPMLNNGSLEVGSGPLVYSWLLPPLSLNRYLQITLTGVPGPAPDPAIIYASLEYDEGGVHQVFSTETDLAINTRGPIVTFTNVQGAQVISGLGDDDSAANAASGAPRAQFRVQSDGIVTISGVAEDPDRVGQVFVCITTGAACASNGWMSAMPVGGSYSTWSFNFDPPADGEYTVWAYGTDVLHKAGDVAGPLKIGADKSAPAVFNLDQANTLFAKTTNIADRTPVVLFTGQVQDSAGPFMSGAGGVALLQDQASETVPVDNPGAQSSTFHIPWTPPVWGEGSTVRTASGDYEVFIGAMDQAGNVASTPKSVRVVVDDTPPLVYGQPPQTQASLSLNLSGLADDTGLVRQRTTTPPFVGKTSANASTRFALTNALGKAVVVGDLNGDAIDDVVLLLPAVSGLAPTPSRVALFFGKPGGLPGQLSAANADVTFQGELPVGNSVYGMDAARVGDVNGDGVDDLFVGDPFTDAGKGRAYLVLGKRTGWSNSVNLSAADWRLSVVGSTNLGAGVAGAGDVNGDGLADLLVGAKPAAALAPTASAWLFLGRESGAPSAPAAAFVAPTGATDPPALAGLGDANGDGLSDMLLAFPGAAVALINGRTTDGWLPGLISLNNQSNALFAARGTKQSVAAAGDVNGDGLADLLVGDPEAITPAVFLVFGRRAERAWPIPPASLALATQADASWISLRFTRLGAGLATLGDVDGDGRADLAVGQPGAGSGPNRVGLLLSSEIAHSRDQEFSSAAQMIPGTANSQRLGDYLSAGDVSGDHIVDLLMGAPGENAAYLLLGDFDPGRVAGISQVEIGFFGPVTDASQPLSATLPTAWSNATLATTNAAITPWSGSLTLPGLGDYRIYARATDQAGNRSHDREWYLGNVWITGAAQPFSGTMALNVPVLSEQTNVEMQGSLNTNRAGQYLRVYDGYAWHRLLPNTGGWAQAASIPRGDLRTLTLRSVARDAFGNTVQAQRTLNLDTLVVGPNLTDNLPVAAWQTDTSLVLSVTWPAPQDGSGIAKINGVIDANPETEPTSSVTGNQMSKNLNEAGVYYAHVLVEDGTGNQVTARTGPYLLNRSQTPSLIFADGYLDRAGGEYPASTLLNYDPYAAHKPAALWGTWNAKNIYLGFPGNRWNEESRLVFYLDTKEGGLNSGLHDGPAHTLPFAADYALLIGGKRSAGYELFQANGSWQAVGDPKSLVARAQDTEVVLDRTEIGASGGLGLLVLAEDGDGVWAVLPAAARPSTDEYLSGPLALGDSLRWTGLGNDALPNAGLTQRVAPQITVLPEWDNVVTSGGTATFQVLIQNPDIGPYSAAALDLQVDEKLALLSAQGARCQSCPERGNKWTLLVDVAAGGTQTVTVQANVLGQEVTGVVPLVISAGLVNSGLLGAAQPYALGEYVLDHGSVVMQHPLGLSDIYVKPGDFVVDVFPNLDLSMLSRCFSQVEVNPGTTGWQAQCWLGDCTVVRGTITANTTQKLEVRTTGANGRSSQPLALNVIADAVAPTTTLSPTLVVSGSLPFVEGLAWDTFPTTRAPARVEVNFDGGPFFPALLTTARTQRVQAAEGGQMDAETTRWRLPLQLSWEDGKRMQVTARSVDEAGNVGRSVGPMEIVLDNLGPQVTMSQKDSMLQGTITDGSGVADLEISLNGGRFYVPVVVKSGEWAFNTLMWRGDQTTVAILRTTDIYGNRSILLAPFASSLGSNYHLFLPSVSQGVAGGQNQQNTAAVEAESAAILETVIETDTEMVPETTPETTTEDTPDSAEEPGESADAEAVRWLFLPVLNGSGQ